MKLKIAHIHVHVFFLFFDLQVDGPLGEPIWDLKCWIIFACITTKIVHLQSLQNFTV